MIPIQWLFSRRRLVLQDSDKLTIRIRQQLEDIMMLDIEYAVQKNIDESLWTHVHYKVIDEYRKRIVAVFSFLRHD
jgi:hypothetical protein